MTQTPDDAEHDTFSQHPYEDWEHRDAARKITATYASQVFVQPLADGMIRLNFGEAHPDDLEPRYHTSVVISARNGMDLASIIHRVSYAVLNPAPPPIVRTNVEPPVAEQPLPDPEEQGGG